MHCLQFNVSASSGVENLKIVFQHEQSMAYELLVSDHRISVDRNEHHISS